MTPLTAIGGFAKLLAEGHAGPVNSEQHELLGLIQSGVQRLTRLASELLEAEKGEEGPDLSRSEDLDFGELLRELESTARVLVGGKSALSLQFQIPQGGLVVRGNRDRLLHAIQNLIANAIKYTPQGRVEVEVEPGPHEVCLRVKDTGVGMTLEEQRHLFEKGYRAPSGFEVSVSGVGLGLFTARRWIEGHQGELSIHSERGVGTVASVRLPLKSSESLTAR